MIYLLVVILLIFLMYRYDYKREPLGFQISFYLILLLFILIGGLRYRIGGDTVVYLEYYKNLHPIGSIGGLDFTRSRFAPGFVIITSIFKTFTSDFTYFQVFHSLFVNTVIFFFIRRYCRNVFFCILIYFFYLYVFLIFEQIRESMAVAVFLLAWPWFKNGIWWKWYIAAFCAMMFHVSAVILFILPLINLPWIREFFKFGKRTWFICLSIFILAYVVQTKLFKYVEMISVTEAMLDRAQEYGKMLNKSEVLNINRILGSFIHYILYPILALYVIYKKKKDGFLIVKDSKELQKETMMCMISIYISIFTIFVGIFMRYHNYFFLFAIIIMGDWIFSQIYLFKKFMRMSFLYWAILFLPMLTINFYYSFLLPANKSGTLMSYMRYYPYSSVIDQTVDENREKTITYIQRH